MMMMMTKRGAETHTFLIKNALSLSLSEHARVCVRARVSVARVFSSRVRAEVKK